MSQKIILKIVPNKNRGWKHLFRLIQKIEQQQKTNSGQEVYKQQNNATYGKTMENSRNRVNSIFFKTRGRS